MVWDGRVHGLPLLAKHKVAGSTPAMCSPELDLEEMAERPGHRCSERSRPLDVSPRRRCGEAQRYDRMLWIVELGQRSPSDGPPPSLGTGYCAATGKNRLNFRVTCRSKASTRATVTCGSFMPARASSSAIRCDSAATSTSPSARIRIAAPRGVWRI